METENKKKSDTQLVEESVGWAIYYKDDGWLSSCHGYDISERPFLALTYKTKEEAEESLKDAQNKLKLDSGVVVRAWVPAIADLKFEIEQLEKANKITPHYINKIISDLENVIYTLKDSK